MIDEEDQLNGRKLALAKKMADASKAYWVDGIDTPMAERVQMKSEMADIDLRLHELKMQRNERKVRAIEIRRESLTSLLTKALEDLGRHDLVAAAKDAALQVVREAGLYEAFKSRGGAA